MFISIEGIEGSGKSTLLRNLENYFLSKGKKVCLTREPGGSELGKSLRSIILNQDSKISSQAELFLFLADRAQHITDVIKPSLARGEIILCDRFVDSTIVYQGYGRGLDILMLEKLNLCATEGLLPELTFLLDLDAETGLSRAKSRNYKKNMEKSEGRFEAEELNFHLKVREGFLTLASQNKNRIQILNAKEKPNQVAEQAIAIIESLWK